MDSDFNTFCCQLYQTTLSKFNRVMLIQITIYNIIILINECPTYRRQKNREMQKLQKKSIREMPIQFFWIKSFIKVRNEIGGSFLLTQYTCSYGLEIQWNSVITNTPSVIPNTPLHKTLRYTEHAVITIISLFRTSGYSDHSFITNNWL